MESKVLTRTDLERLLKQNHSSVTFQRVQQTDRVSSLWPQFNLIFVDNMIQNFVICIKCRTIIAYRTATGTGGLKKHSKSCEKPSSSKAMQSAITMYYGKKPSIVPEKLKTEVTDAYIDFILLDSRPFKIASDPGFRQFLQTVFNAGKSSTGLEPIQFPDLLPHPTTVSRKIDQIYDLRKRQLVDWCRTLDSYAITVDMWTEKYSGIHFCGATVRHVDPDFYLHSFCLGCKPYTLANQTAPNVRKYIDDLLLEYGLSLNKNSYITTDNEPKMVAALRGANRIGCSDHYLNKVLEHSFTLSNSNCTDVIQVFDLVKSLVANFRRSHRQIKLSRKLQTFSSTRFSGAYYMLNVFNSVYDELVDVFSGSQYQNFEAIDKDLLSELCEFLQLSDKIITMLSEETQPTLHEVIPLRSLLIDHCAPKPDELPGLKKMKQFLKQDIIDKWTSQPEHMLATVVHPRLRDFSGNDLSKKKAFELLKSTVASRTNTSICHSANDNQASLSINECSTTVRATNLLSLCYDKPRTNQALLDEVMLWNQSVFDKSTTDDDLLSFWRKRKDEFPTIASIARKVLAIPASNTSAERLFSSTKITVGDRRTKLGSEKIDKLMFLKKNLIPLKDMFDLKSSSVTINSKRKSDDMNQDDDQDELLFLKKIRGDEVEYDISSDEYESENEN